MLHLSRSLASAATAVQHERARCSIFNFLLHPGLGRYHPSPLRVQYVCLGWKLGGCTANRTCEHRIYFMRMMDYVVPVDEIGN